MGLAGPQLARFCAVGLAGPQPDLNGQKQSHIEWQIERMSEDMPDRMSEDMTVRMPDARWNVRRYARSNVRSYAR